MAHLRALLVPMLTLCLVACASNARAANVPEDFKADCAANLPVTSIQVRLVSSAPEFDYSKTVAELTDMSPSPGGAETLGLTRTRRSMRVSQRGPVWVRRVDGLACVRPVVEMTVTQTTVVFVGKEFLTGTCAFREVKDHELRHVRAHREYAELTARKVEDEMRKAFGNDIYYGQADEVGRRLNHAVQDGWFSYFEQSLQGVKAWNAVIDSPAEYRRLNIACAGEGARVLAARKR